MNKLLLTAALLCGSWLPVLRADDTAATSSSSGHSGKLAFLIPNLYGPGGLTLPNPLHEAHFDAAFQSNFGPFNSAIASQLTSLPIPSPASGFTYSLDKSLGVVSRSSDSFGPILAERAETIGKDKFYFGFGFQHFGFNKIDNVQLNNFPAVFEHVPVSNPSFSKDIITTRNFLDIQLGQMTSFFTYGLTDRLDVSVAVPLVSASLSATSDATIQRIGTGDDTTVHYFDGTNKDRKQFAGSGAATGLGDVVVRLKGTAIRGEKVSVALGTDVRLATGDPYDFLGSGATGVKPFAAVSVRGRFSPHVNLAYQWNGSSVLAGNVVTGQKAKIPSQIQWAAGADMGLTRKLTAAFDLLGQNTRHADRVVASNYTAANGMQFGQTRFERRSLNALNGAAGIKVNPVGNLLVSFNLLFQLNDGGLRARVVPLIGASYTF